MTQIICLTKEDITTKKCGLHYEIVTKHNLIVNFTRDALQEFIKDVSFLLEDAIKKETDVPPTTLEEQKDA
jgi:hypothetical protein